MEQLQNLLSIEELSEFEWAIKVFAIVTLTLVVRLIAMRVLSSLGKRFEKTENFWDDALFEAAHGPLSWLILIFGVLWAIEITEGQLQTALFAVENLDLLRQLSFIVFITTFLTRFVKLSEMRILKKMTATAEQEQAKVDPTTLNAIAKLLRLAVIISAVLVALPTLGIEITALLAAGGVGGLAVGFAAKDLLSNFFGGLMIYLDRPFALGDWVRSPDRDIEGTVEKIGWRLTVIRTFDKRPLYVPNAVFNNIALENPSRMSNRRIKETIGIRYKDADKMADVVRDIKEMLKTHPDIDTNLILMVNFVSYGASSLDFFIYTFTKTTVWAEFHEIKQDVLLKIIKIVHGHGADFAFPTRTIDGWPAGMTQLESAPEPEG